MYSGVKNIIQLFVSLWICSISIAQNSRPNILMILVDDLRYDALSATGHPFFESPSIDRIANEGVKFSNSFAVTSICMPSRSTILTGLYPHIHGVTANRINLNYDVFVTFPMLLQENGYETGMIGKDHTTDGNQVPKPGFNRWVALNSTLYNNPRMNINGQIVVLEGHITDIITDYAVDFIYENADTSFFLLVSHFAVHKPVIPQDHFKGMYDSTIMPLPSTWGEDLSTKPTFIQEMDSLHAYWLIYYIRNYYETLAGVEESVDTLLSTLDQLDILDETLIIFASDHGFLLGEHNLWEKNYIYEESIRVPFFIRFPNGFASGVELTENSILNIDFAPTILRAAGITVPEEMQGIPLQDLILGLKTRDNFLYEYWPNSPPDNPHPPMRMIRNSNYKYSVYPKTNEIEELYDLRSDPLEELNLYFNPSYDDVRDMLRCKLDSIRFALGDTLRGIAEIHIPYIQAVLGDTVDIPVQVEFPEDSLIDRFTMSISGFSGQLEFIEVNCFNSCLL